MLPTAFRNGQSPATFAPVEGLDRVFNRLLNLDRPFGEDGVAASAWGAPVAIWQDEDHVYVEAELPGVSEADLDMTVHRGELTIQGERKPAEGRKYLYNGRQFGKFRRTITLPEEVNAEAVEARLTDGVLLITCPKRAETKPRKIQVNKA